MGRVVGRVVGPAVGRVETLSVRPTIELAALEPRRMFAAAPVFKVSSLVSNTPTVPASHQYANVVNSWGIAIGPTTSIWVANNGSGVASLFDGNGNQHPLNVTIPAPAGSDAASLPTGAAYNGSTGFKVSSTRSAEFIFAGEDGLISGWNSRVDPSHAIIKVDNHNLGAVYKGLAIANFNGDPYIYATNFKTGKIEIYDSTWKPVHLGGSFRDSQIPTGYAPFGIQNINGLIYVTYASQDFYGEGDVAGKGHGYVDVYLPDGTLSRRLVKRGTLNSPWGVARIPGGFGKYKRSIAVGNFGDGLIQVFDPQTGEFKGYLRKAKNNHVVQIDGLWGLAFGNGTKAGGSTNDLFFTAGPNHESNGLFGKLTMVAPAASAGIRVTAASPKATLFSDDKVTDDTCDHEVPSDDAPIA